MLYEIAGYIGLFLMLLSYYLLSKGKLIGISATYQLLNLVGAIMLGINAYENKAIPVLILEIFWCIIAIKTIFKIKGGNKKN